MKKEEIACELTKFLLDNYPPILWKDKREDVLEQYKWFYNELKGKQNIDNIDNIGITNTFKNELFPLRKLLKEAEKSKLILSNGEIEYIGKTTKKKIFQIEVNYEGE